MTYQVWHVNHPDFMDNSPATLAAFPLGFTHVADVETANVGNVFALTNHIDHRWWDNPEVTVLVPWDKTQKLQLRSTSVGDIITTPKDAAAAAFWSFRGWTIQMIGLKKF